MPKIIFSPSITHYVLQYGGRLFSVRRETAGQRITLQSPQGAPFFEDDYAQAQHILDVEVQEV